MTRFKPGGLEAHPKTVVVHRLGHAAVAFSAQAGATASLDITRNADIAAGHAATGPTSAVFDWTRFFAPGTVWMPGVLTPNPNGPIGIVNPAGGWVIAADGSGIHTVGLTIAKHQITEQHQV